MDEVDVRAVDLGCVLGQGVELRFCLPPVVVGSPVARECLDCRQLDALRPIRYELLGGQARRRDAATELVQSLVRNLNVEWTNVGRGLNDGTHDYLPVTRACLRWPDLRLGYFEHDEERVTALLQLHPSGPRIANECSRRRPRNTLDGNRVCWQAADREKCQRGRQSERGSRGRRARGGRHRPLSSDEHRRPFWNESARRLERPR